jgi:two-component system, sensor histidine kinase ChiS
MSRVRFLIACLLALWMWSGAGVQAATAAPQAVAGHLAWPAPAQERVAANGQWGFAWHRFVDPHWQQLPTSAFAPVSTAWNDVTADGKPAGPDGWGSYVLQVDCPAGQSLAVEAFGQRTASRLFINGVEVAAHGEPGPSRDASLAAVYTRIPITREFACPLRLTLHISNFDHRGGGFVRPIFIGPDAALERARESRILWHAALLTAYLGTGLVSLIFYAAWRRERIPLVFGLFCIAMAVYADMIGERLFLRPLAHQLGWVPYMRIEYLSWIAAMALFLATLRALFPGQIRPRVLKVVMAMLGAGALSVLLLRPGLYSHIVLPGQAIAVLVAAYLATAILRARDRSRLDARVLLVGVLGVLATLALDLLLIDAPGPDHKFAPFGFAFFLLSPAVVIARRMTKALGAEERARTLEENARLREDVERMSRHDLKTPLNSILGVTRLLRDDARLDTEQRELVGILQRAALRMLEMVNLSLGLFRMETGSYPFRPQAVDLRDVVTRVLVDLHSHAEAFGVTVHWQGSRVAPVYVRAEELLCYSILANLVKNAVEATARGGQVTVTLHPGDPVVLSVHNPGEVPAEVVPRFFDKYVTGGKSGGTGLGTYSARLMAWAQRGDLQMHTGTEGTTLTLMLSPLRGEAPAPQPATPTDADAPWVNALPSREVLLVDDDEYLRLVTRRLLPNPPFNVETAANGQAAMQALQRRWPHYLLLDMEMPLQDGVQTARWVREQEALHGRPRCHVLMLSGNDDEASMQRAREAGADRFLVKPVSREALLAAMRELEAGRAAVPPAATSLVAPMPSGSQPESPGSLPFAAGLPPKPAAPAPKQPAAPAPEDDIVVVEPEWAGLFPDFVRLQSETVDGMARALLAGDREDVAFLAHRAGGGLATMGMGWAARQSRAIERDALQAPTPDLQQRIETLRQHLRRVRLKTD